MDTGYCGCNFIGPSYSCDKLKDIDGIPKCICTPSSVRIKLVTDEATFLVCSPILGWLMGRLQLDAKTDKTKISLDKPGVVNENKDGGDV